MSDFSMNLDNKNIEVNFDIYENIKDKFPKDKEKNNWLLSKFILKNINPKKSKKSITMKILSTENDSYTFEYSIVGDDL